MTFLLVLPRDLKLLKRIRRFGDRMNSLDNARTAPAFAGAVLGGGVQ